MTKIRFVKLLALIGGVSTGLTIALSGDWQLGLGLVASSIGSAGALAPQPGS